jgi:hypothetical protein
MEEGTCTTEAEADSEPAAFGQRRDGRVILGSLVGRRRAVGAQPPLSSSS